jgi:hypothetical protein
MRAPSTHAAVDAGSWEGLPCREGRSLPSARLALSTSIHSVTLSSTLHHTSAAVAAKHPRGAVFRKCGPAWTRRETQHRATPRVSTCPRAAGDCSGWLHCMCVCGGVGLPRVCSLRLLSLCVECVSFPCFLSDRVWMLECVRVVPCCLPLLSPLVFFLFVSAARVQSDDRGCWLCGMKMRLSEL